MKRPSVCVVVRTCGERGQMLSAAIDSIKAQRYPFVGIVVVWDTEDRPFTPKAAELMGLPCLGTNPPAFDMGFGVSHVYPGRVRRAEAANVGVRLAAAQGADYVGFLDDDDQLHEGWAGRLVMALEADLEAGAAHCDVQVVHCSPENMPRRLGHCYEGPFTVEELRASNRKPNNAWMFRRAVLEAEPFRAEDDPCEDYGLLLRLAQRGISFRHAPGCGAEYRIRGDEASNTPRPEMAEATERVRRLYACSRRAPVVLDGGVFGGNETGGVVPPCPKP